jgi:hypothetical protein
MEQPCSRGEAVRRDEAWDLVRRHPLLRGEPKIAWRLLWELAGGKPGTVRISPADIGLDQGREDPKRCGLRAIESLELAGLIEVVDRRSGRWSVYVVQPAELERARRRPHDPQRELPGVEDGEQDAAVDAGEATVRLETAKLATVERETIGVADVAPHPPAPSQNLRKKQAQRAPSTSEPFVPSVTSLPSEPSLVAQPFGALLVERAAAAVARRPGSRETETAIEDLAARIRQAVADPQLRSAPVLRVARAVVLGELDQDELRSILGLIDTKRRDGTLERAWWYFVGAARAAFKRAGLEWPRENPPTSGAR